MVELLVVMTIIAILMSISFVVYGAAVENARSEATRATLRQLDSALQERYDAFRRLNFRPFAQQFKAAYEAGGTNTPTTIPLTVAEIIVRKDRYKAAFPQRFEDLWGFDGLPDTSDDAPLWRLWRRTAGIAAPTMPTRVPEIESSELLYLTLTSGGAFGGSVLPLDRLRANHLKDANNNLINEIYDEWGRPLRFYNQPTRLVRPGGEISAPPIDYADITLTRFRSEALPLIPTLPKITADLQYDFTTFIGHPLNIDPDDPTGALTAAQNTAPTTNICRGTYSLNGVPNQQPLTEGYYGTFDTYWTPLIVSAGPDGRLGLNEPAQAGAAPSRLAEPTGISQDDLTDNITNRQP